MKIMNSLVLLAAFGMQMPTTVVDRQPSSVNAEHERAGAPAEAPALLAAAALEEVVGGISRKWKCFAFFATVAAVGLTAAFLTGGAAVLGMVGMMKVGELGALACLI